MFPIFFVAPLFLAIFLLDAAIFFVAVRLLRRAWPVQPLQCLDRIGSAGVDWVTSLVADHTRRWWNWSFSPAGEEAVALGALMCLRMLLTPLVL